MSGKNKSKFLALILRHHPEKIGLTLDEHGWADIETLLSLLPSNPKFTREELNEIVENNDKKRFVISEDGTKIRAAQGHSIQIDLELTPKDPPPILYHGTAIRFLDSIMKTGLSPRGRQYVHLSVDIETAINVGRRYGKPTILKLDIESMKNDGKEFYQAENGVWLTNAVEPKYLSQVQ